MGTNPIDEQIEFAKKAVEYRELFYRGQDEAIERDGPVEGPVIWSGSKLGEQYSANNKWHMAQSMMFGSLAQTGYLRMLVVEAKLQSKLLNDIKNLLGGGKRDGVQHQ